MMKVKRELFLPALILALVQAGASIADEGKSLTSPTDPAGEPAFRVAEDRGYVGYSSRYEEDADGLGRIRVLSVKAGGPADRAGLKSEDLIVRIEGKSFSFENDLDMVQSLSWIKAGARLKLDVQRRGEVQTVDFVAGKMSAEQLQSLNRWVEVAIGWFQEGKREACQLKMGQQRKAVTQKEQALLALKRLSEGLGAELTVSREAGTNGLAFFGQGIELPAGFDLSAMPPMEELAERLRRGDSMRFRVWWDDDSDLPSFELLALPSYLESGLDDWMAE